MQRNQLLHQSKSDSGSVMRSRFCTLYTMEALEEARQLRFWDANARVSYRKLGVITAPAEGNSDAALESMLEGVGDEVEDNFLPHLRIDVDRLGQRRAVNRQDQASLFHCGAEPPCPVCGVCVAI